MSLDAVGQPAEVAMTIHITRAATGLIETYNLVGRVTAPPELQQSPPTEQPALLDTQET